MTSVAHSVQSESQVDQSESQIDVRCSSALSQRSASEGRCQLFAGHDGPHAIMYAQDGERRVQLWKTRGESAAAIDTEVAAVQRPWMFGYPVPAWFESHEPS